MTSAGSILLADDEEKIVRLLGRALREEGHDVVETTSACEARRLVYESSFDLVVLDNVMPDLTGIDLIRELVAAVPAEERPHLLLMTGQPSVEGAVEAMKAGALDYLRKPFEVDDLVATVARVLEMRELRVQNHYLMSEREDDFDYYGIVGRSPAMLDVLRKAQMVARSKSTVLITGETGTGKELVARAIHAHSAERARPLIKVNCAAIPDNLLESELFGYVRGAFTGAANNKRGKFALADGSTIFLDEIGTLSPCLQPKILRVLQEREFEPLGSERTEHVDIRVVAATNRDLKRMVSEGRFLEDLYYRLNVIPLHLPPLRERPGDIPALVDHFVRKHARQAGKRVDRIQDAALQALTRYEWPGNVRELENALERAVVLAGGATITAHDVSIAANDVPESCALPTLTLRHNVEWVERETVRRALAATSGIKKDAADMMGISQRALSYYLSKHKLE